MALFGSPQHPKGPSLKRSYYHTLDFSGTRVAFATPRHSETTVPFNPMPGKYNLYEQELYGVRADIENDVPGIICYTEGWSFFGRPVIHGRMGDLTLSITAFHNPRHGSLFRPAHLEKSIEDRLYVASGPGAGKRRFITLPHSRLRWGVSSVHGINWAHYDVVNVDDLDGHTAWVIPLTDEHSLYFFFTRFIFKQDTQLNTAYDNLIEHIMASVKIEWSAEAQRQQDEAKQRWPGETLSANLPELTWPDNFDPPPKPDSDFTEVVSEPGSNTRGNIDA